MKFSDGCWMTREGFYPSSPAQIHTAEITNEKLTLYAPFNRIEHRGATLDGGMMTIEITTPAKDYWSKNESSCWWT